MLNFVLTFFRVELPRLGIVVQKILVHREADKGDSVEKSMAFEFL